MTEQEIRNDRDGGDGRGGKGDRDGSGDRQPVPRPARPEMGRPPAPVSAPRLRPDVVTWALGVLRTGIAVGAVAVLTAIVWRGDVTDRLVVELENSTAQAAARQQAVDILLYGSVGLMALMLIIELVLASRIAAGSRGARILLSMVIPLHLAALIVLHEVVVRETWYGAVILACLLVQGAFSLVALLLLWHPHAGRWLRNSRKAPQPDRTAQPD